MSIMSEFNELRSLVGTSVKKDCSLEEVNGYRNLLRENKPLPQGVFWINKDDNVSVDQAVFAKYENLDVNKDELVEFLLCKCFGVLNTIKNCVVFFTVLVVLELIGGLILLFSMM